MFVPTLQVALLFFDSEANDAKEPRAKTGLSSKALGLGKSFTVGDLKGLFGEVDLTITTTQDPTPTVIMELVKLLSQCVSIQKNDPSF